MPHVVVKLWPGKSDDQKRRLTDAIVEDVASILGYDRGSVSVGMEEVAPGEWMSGVYAPDIANKWDSLTHKPGYGPGPRRRARN